MGELRDFEGNVHLHEKDVHEANLKSGGSGGGGAMGAAGGGLVLIFIFGPILLAKLVGFLWGLLLKLGFVGRILTTFLMLAAGPFIMSFPLLLLGASMSGTQLNPLTNLILTSIIWGLFAASVFIPTTWYFLWHYDTVKLIGATNFSEIIKKFAQFFWFGFIAAGIISLVMNATIGGFVSIGACIAGFIYYFKETSEHNRIARANPSLRIPSIVKLIVMLVMVGLSVSFGVAVGVDQVTSKKESKERGIATAAQFSEGMTAVVLYPIQIYDPSRGRYTGEYGAPVVTDINDTTILKYINDKDTLRITGEPINSGANSWMVSVEHQGTRGYINTKYISPLGKDITGGLDTFKAAKNENVSAVVTARNTMIYTSRGSLGSYVKKVNRNTILTVTGEAVTDVSFSQYFMVPVEHEGAKGFIRLDHIRRK